MAAPLPRHGRNPRLPRPRPAYGLDLHPQWLLRRRAHLRRQPRPLHRRLEPRLTARHPSHSHPPAQAGLLQGAEPYLRSAAARRGTSAALASRLRTVLQEWDEQHGITGARQTTAGQRGPHLYENWRRFAYASSGHRPLRGAGILGRSSHKGRPPPAQVARVRRSARCICSCWARGAQRVEKRPLVTTRTMSAP